MSLLNWRSDFELGVPVVDRGHCGLIDARNTVHDLDQQNADKQLLDDAIQQLVQLTVEHFRDEEAYMEELGYDDLERHEPIHKDMLRRVAEHHDAFRQGDGSVVQDFYRFSTHWLAAHICHIDRKHVPTPWPVSDTRPGVDGAVIVP